MWARVLACTPLDLEPVFLQLHLVPLHARVLDAVEVVVVGVVGVVEVVGVRKVVSQVGRSCRFGLAEGSKSKTTKRLIWFGMN